MQDERSGTMPQDLGEAWEVISNVHIGLPVIQRGCGPRLFYLVKETGGDLKRFIDTGLTEVSEFHVLSEEEERGLAGQWEGRGLTVTYHSQKMDYMNEGFTVIYMRVSDPDSGANISIIPWFLLHGRPYPVFV